jgi:hypothetical protein
MTHHTASAPPDERGVLLALGEVPTVVRSPPLAQGPQRPPLGASNPVPEARPASRLSLLFPTAGPSRSPAWLVAVGYVVGLAVLAGGALLRQPGVPATTTVWAEDGRIFYAQASRLSFWQTLGATHNGYAQLFPRLAVQVARLFPPADAATTFALTGALSVAGVGCFVFHVAKGHIVSPSLRAVLAVAMVLLPVANTELLDNLVNVPWWLFFGAFWALLWRPRSLPGRVAAALMCFLAAASEPLVALFVPLAAARAVTLREPQEQAGGAGLLLGLVYQAAVILPNGTKALGSPGDFEGIGRAFATRAGAGLFGGVKGTDWLFHHRDLSVSVGAAVLAVIVVAALGTGSARVRLFTLVAGCYSLVCFVTPVWLRDVAPAVALWPVQVAGRYQAVPLLLLASVVLVVADHFARDGIWNRSAVRVAGRAGPGERTPGGGVPWRVLGAVGVCLALFVPSWLADFRDPNARQAGPNWSTEVAKAAAGCRHGQDKSVTVAIDPARWTASLPCNAFATGH